MAGAASGGAGTGSLVGAGTGSTTGGSATLPTNAGGPTSTGGAGGGEGPSGGGGDLNAADAGAGNAPCTGEATYSVAVNVTWADEAVSGRHYTTLIGAVHAAAMDVWHLGGMATSGVQQMAESGGTQMLSAEVQAAIDQGKALSLVKFSGGSPPATSMGQFTVNSDFSLISLGSMMAPTPDLFIGLSSVNLCEGGTFIAAKTMEAVVYDAGTKDGDDFTYGDGPTSPHVPIGLGKQFSAPQGSITLQKL